MRIPQLQMESRFARIEIHQTDARVEIRQEPAKLHMKQPHAELSIRTSPGRLSIDQTKAFEDMNLMSIIKRNDKHSSEGMQAIQEGTARRAREGRELMAIEHGGNPIAQQAKRISNPPPKPLGIKFIPSHFAVRTNYQPAEVHIDVTVQKPEIQAEIHQPEFTYHSGQVETRLAERNDLKITVLES